MIKLSEHELDYIYRTLSYNTDLVIHKDSIYWNGVDDNGISVNYTFTDGADEYTHYFYIITNGEQI